MPSRISPMTTATVMLLGLTFLAVYHALVIAGFLPETNVWGGQGTDASVSVKALEIVALAITALMALVVAAKVDLIPVPRMRRALRVLMWLMFLYFALNTVGNLTSSSGTEQLFFTPVSIVLALGALRLAMDP